MSFHDGPVDHPAVRRPGDSGHGAPVTHLGRGRPSRAAGRPARVMRRAVGSAIMWTRGRGVDRRTEELSHGDRDAGAVRPPAVDQPAETAEDEEPGSLAPGPLIHGYAVARDPLG